MRTRKVDALALRMRGRRCGRSPRVRVIVDGRAVMSRYVTSRTWRRYEGRVRMRPRYAPGVGRVRQPGHEGHLPAQRDRGLARDPRARADRRRDQPAPFQERRDLPRRAAGQLRLGHLRERHEVRRPRADPGVYAFDVPDRAGGHRARREARRPRARARLRQAPAQVGLRAQEVGARRGARDAARPTSRPWSAATAGASSPGTSSTSRWTPNGVARADVLRAAPGARLRGDGAALRPRDRSGRQALHQRDRGGGAQPEVGWLL